MASWPRCWWHEFQAKKAKKVGYQYGVLIGCLGRMILHLSPTCLTLACGCIGLHDVAFAAHLSRARLPLSPMLLLRWATWFCTSLHPTPSLKQFSGFKRVASLGWKLFLCLRLSPTCLLHATAVALVSCLPAVTCRRSFSNAFFFAVSWRATIWRLIQYFPPFGVNRFLFQWGFNTNKWVI